MLFLNTSFYYNKQLLYSFINKKILNDQYYSKFIYCNKKIIAIDYKIRFFKKKLSLKKLYFKYKIENQINYIYIDNSFFLEYIIEDFLYKNLINVFPGFSLKLKDKYFYNIKIPKYDFIEKFFLFKKNLNYLQNILKNFKKLSTNKTKYKTIVPLKIIKGGFIALGFGFIGFLPFNQIFYTKKTFTNITKRQMQYLIPTIYFFKSVLQISWFFKKKKSKLKYFSHLYIIFFKKKKLLKK